MENNRKKHRRDRYDAYYLEDVDSMHILMAHLLPNRTENEAIMNETVDMTPVLEYVEKKNSENPQYKYTVFHVIMAAMAKTVYLRPKMNQFLAAGRMYERKDISFSFTAKNKFSDNAGESLLIFKLNRESGVSPVTQVHDFICGNIYKIRNEEMVDDTTDMMNIITKVPPVVLKYLTKFLTYLNEHGRLPKILRPLDPYSSSVFVSNLGSIKLSANYHHLANWGTNSIFLVIGEMMYKPFFKEDGTYEMKKALDLAFTIDERIADGYYFSNTMKVLRKILANPQILDETVDTPVEL